MPQGLPTDAHVSEGGGEVREMERNYRFTEDYREVKSRQVNIQKEVLRLLRLCLSPLVSTCPYYTKCWTDRMNLLHLPKRHLIQPVILG